MAKLTMLFGVLLIALGVTGYLLTGSAHPTSLIPVVFGVPIFLCGVLANTEDSKRRMLSMHIAVTLGLLGFLGSAFRIVMAFIWSHGEPFLYPAAVEAQAAMAGICLLFVALCVRSFIAARRNRNAVA